ncbi:hypothetical protein [Pseudonocardia sp. ICBG601]|uniref:hypothetical protein n=1 Tax=Pseudonocardia sp. ICBG601 TaxID=2846759 RepID=UPI001CF6649F|nr:hypothetical protein [Pseudonocardia sp. ICBG601]
MDVAGPQRDVVVLASCARIGRWSPAISGYFSSSRRRWSQVRRIESMYSELPL